MSGIGAAQVGHELGVSADTVRRHWPEWMAAQGFPRPLFNGGLLRWDASAVTAWKERRSQPDTPATAALDTDWAAIARRRGAALDAGRDPESLTA